jgi:putative membrane protein
MDLRRLLIAGTLNFSLAVLAGLAGATQTIGDAAGFDIFARRFWRKTLEAGSPIADLVLAHQVIAVAIGSVTLVVLGLATGLTRTILREYGFRLDRAANGLRRRRGLLTITDVTLPIARVQAAIIGSGPVRERYGWSDLKLQSLAKDEGSSGDHVVAPLAREDELAIVLRELGWRAFDPPPAWMRTPAAYALSLTIGLAPLLGLFVAASAIDLRISAAGCLILVALITTRWLAWRRFRYALEDDRLLIRSGWWKRRLIILPLSSIQSADLTESVFSRWFGVAALTFGVASGRGFSRHGIPALDRQVARTLRDRVMRPRPS